MPESPAADHLPLHVRLADMAEAEARYQATPPDDRLALHLALTFYRLLSTGERMVLERRFPHELAGLPDDIDATQGTRGAWDLRSRELVVCMLQFGDKVLSARMDLVGSVAPEADVAVLAMTATGSFLELGRPMPGGHRRFVYRASARPGGRRVDGAVQLADRIVLGNALSLGTLHTSELIVLASGKALPPDDDFVPGTRLFGPVEDETAPATSDPLRLGMTRFRVLSDAAGNASENLSRELQKRAASLAEELQRLVQPAGGFALADIAGFHTGSGARYEVVTSDGHTDLVRHAPDGETVQWLHDATIGSQTIVEGAPVVVFFHASRAQKVAFVFRVAGIVPLPGHA